jgi:hypothetical protein
MDPQKHEYINNMQEEHKHNKMWRENVNITKCKWKCKDATRKKKVEPKLKFKPFVLLEQG